MLQVVVVVVKVYSILLLFLDALEGRNLEEIAREKLNFSYLVFRRCLEKDVLWSGLIGCQGILLTSVDQVERDGVLLIDEWLLLSWL